MVDCHPKGTPLDVDLNLGLLDCPDEVNAECSLIFQVCINGQGHSTRPWLCSIFLVQVSTQTWSETLDRSNLKERQQVSQRNSRARNSLHQGYYQIVTRKSKAQLLNILYSDFALFAGYSDTVNLRKCNSDERKSNCTEFWQSDNDSILHG